MPHCVRLTDLSLGMEKSYRRWTRYVSIQSQHCVCVISTHTQLGCVIARKLLKSMSIKQGIKYDSPDSARDIPGFIEFHKLNVDEMLHPVEWFST